MGYNLEEKHPNLNWTMEFEGIFALTLNLLESTADENWNRWFREDRGALGNWDGN